MNTEVAWAAGFFDGEGCVTWTKGGDRSKKPGYLHLGVAQSGSPDKLNRFRDALGMGKVYGPYGPGGSKTIKQDRYTWHVTGRKAFTAMEILRPFLTGDKAEKFDRIVLEGRVVDQSGPKLCNRGLHILDEHGVSWGNGNRVCGPCVRDRLARKKAERVK